MTKDVRSAIRLRIDRASVTLFAPCRPDGLPRPGDIRRAYCAQALYHAILICPRGMRLADLAGKVVEANVTETPGDPAWARPTDVGLWHTLIVVLGLLPGGVPEVFLTEVLMDGQRDQMRRADKPP